MKEKHAQTFAEKAFNWGAYLTFLSFLIFFFINSPLLFCFYFSLQEVNLYTQAVSVWVSLCYTFQGRAFKVKGISKLDPKVLKRLHPETVLKETELQACPFGSSCAREEKYSDNESLYQWLKNSETKHHIRVASLKILVSSGRTCCEKPGGHGCADVFMENSASHSRPGLADASLPGRRAQTK